MVQDPEADRRRAPAETSLTVRRQRFWLRFRDHDLELGPGETLVGRSPRCQVVIDDPLVSRQHARFRLGADTVELEDLGSVNGVLVNGERVRGSRVLASGDQITLGQQQLELLIVAEASPQKRDRAAMNTLAGSRRTERQEAAAGEPVEATRQQDAFVLLCGVADKVLSLGRGQEAERILSSTLRSYLQAARSGVLPERDKLERIATYAMRVAEATGKGEWVDYLFELYTLARRPLPAPVVERLYAAVRSLSPVQLSAFRDYLTVLRGADNDLGPAERFVVRRIEGLEQIVALR